LYHSKNSDLQKACTGTNWTTAMLNQRFGKHKTRDEFPAKIDAGCTFR
jgi:hypothetical protein